MKGWCGMREGGGKETLLDRLWKTHRRLYRLAELYAESLGVISWEPRGQELWLRGPPDPITLKNRTDAAKFLFQACCELYKGIWTDKCDIEPDIAEVLSDAFDPPCLIGDREVMYYHEVVESLGADLLYFVCDALRGPSLFNGQKFSAEDAFAGQLEEAVFVSACEKSDSLRRIWEQARFRGTMSILMRLRKEIIRADRLARTVRREFKLRQSPEEVDRAPFHRPEWFEKWNIYGSTLRGAARDYRLRRTPVSAKRWVYSEPDARHLWPEKFERPSPSDTKRR